MGILPIVVHTSTLISTRPFQLIMNTVSVAFLVATIAVVFHQSQAAGCFNGQLPVGASQRMSDGSIAHCLPGGNSFIDEGFDTRMVVADDKTENAAALNEFKADDYFAIPQRRELL